MSETLRSRAAFLAAILATGVAAPTSAGPQEGEPPKPRIWASSPPEGCPFKPSTTVTGIEFTGTHQTYTKADTWYPSWASDNRMYSPFADGPVNTANSICYRAPATPGRAVIEGDDPMSLKIVNPATFTMSASPYGGRYPCGSLVHDGVWYYGTYCLMNENGSIESDIKHKDLGRINWGVLGPFCGFHVCDSRNLKDRDLRESWRGEFWTPSPHTPEKPMFPDPSSPGKAVRIGAPHFVDFGKNLEHSPDGHAYLVAHGAGEDDPMPRPANASWITGDHIYLLRVKPGLQTMNNPSAYEFFAGSTDGQEAWTWDFAKMKPLIDWNNHCGCVTVTYDAPLKKYLMCVTDGWPTSRSMDTYVLEADRLTGPWRMVSYMAKFGEQAYFVNLPSRFIGGDGRTAWLCYSGNFAWGRTDPPGGKYAMCLQQVRLLGPR